MIHRTLIQEGRRFALIEGNWIQLQIRDNKRKAPRPVRHGERMLVTEADCFHAGLLWLRKGYIDFGDRDRGW